MKTKYITVDGKEFDILDQAEKHEMKILKDREYRIATFTGGRFLPEEIYRFFARHPDQISKFQGLTKTYIITGKKPRTGMDLD